MTGMPESAVAPDRRRRRRIIAWSMVGVIVLLIACAIWIVLRGLQAKDALEASLPLVDKVQAQISSGDAKGAAATSRVLADHLHTARDDTDDPIWRAAEIIPGLGPNLSAVRKVSSSASDVTDQAIIPLAQLAGTLNFSSFSPVNGKVPLKPLTRRRRPSRERTPRCNPTSPWCGRSIRPRPSAQCATRFRS